MLRSLLLSHHVTHMQTAFYALTCYFLYTLSDTLAKILMANGFDKSFVLVISCIPATIIIGYFLIKRHGIKRAFHTPFKTLQTLRGLALIGITYFGLQALTMLPLTDFYGIIFSAPLISTIGAFFIFKEKVSLAEWLVIIIGFVGILVVAQPDFDNFNFEYLYAFMAVLCVSSAGLIVRKIGSSESPFLYIIFGNIAIFSVNIYFAIQSDIPPITYTHLMLFTVYCTAIPIAVITMSALFARAPSVASIVPFQYTQIIWGAVFGYLIFNTIPSINTLIGSGIVIASGLYIIFHHKRKRV